MIHGPSGVARRRGWGVASFGAALVACSSFGTTSDAPSSDAGVAPPVPDASGEGGGASSPEGGAACAATTFDLAGFVRVEGDTNLNDGVLTSSVPSQEDRAYREMDLPAASSLVMSFEVETTGVDNVYAELGCSLDLFHHPNEEFPVTELYFAHEKSRALTFKIVHARTDQGQDQDLFEATPAEFASTPATHVFRLALDAIEDTRLVGAMTLNGAPRPFDVALPGPVVRITAYCGLYYADVPSGTFKVTVRRFTGTYCPR